MRKVVVSEFVSVDGVMEDPRWTFRFVSEGWEGFKFDELAASDALLLGRVTYEGFAAAWPQMAEQTGEYGAMMNGYPKYVASTTLKEPLEWNANLIEGNLAEEVSRLKQQPGKDLVVLGSGALVQSLMRHNLVDTYVLLIHPLVLGTGRRLFAEGGPTTTLRLVDTRTTTTGVVIATYQAAEPA